MFIAAVHLEALDKIMGSSGKTLGVFFDSSLKGTVHPKMKILSFTHPQVDPNLYECVCSEHKGRYSEESL